MKLFEYVTLAEKKVSGLRINFLWVFNITVTYSTNKGNHVNIGFGITPFEISVQYSIWEFSYAGY